MWFCLKPTWPFSDDYTYAHNAFLFNNESLKLSYNPFQNRFGVFIPVALIFKVLGINPFTISLWPLISSLITITFAYYFLAVKVNKTLALIVSILIAVNVLQITYSIALFPDIIVSMYFFLIVLILYQRESKKPLVYSILLPIVFFLGIITKETILLILPFIIIVLIIDFIKAKYSSFWKSTALSSLIFLLCYLCFYWMVTDDPFYQFKSMVDLNNNRLMDDENARIIRTLFNTNIFLWINDNLGIVLILILSVPSFFLDYKKTSDFKFHITLYAWFMLITMIILFHSEKYGPLFMMPRVWILLIVPLSILSAYSIVESTKKKLIILLIIFTLFTLGNIPLVSTQRILFYSTFPIIIATVIVFNKPLLRLLLILPFVLLCLNFVNGNSNHKTENMYDGGKIKQKLDSLNAVEQSIIFTTEDFVENHIIYNGFKKYTNLFFYSFEKYDSIQTKESVYLIDVKKTEFPDFLINNPTDWKLVFKKNNTTIFKKIK